MEEKKFDLNSIIGFVLIFGILIWIMYQNQPSDKEIAAEKAKKELIAKQEAQAKADKTKTAVLPVASATTPGDTVQLAQLQKTLGGFAYSATLPSAKEGFTTIENEKIKLKIANKGGYIVEATLKEFKKFEKNSGQLVELIKDNNANLNIQLPSTATPASPDIVEPIQIGLKIDGSVFINQQLVATEDWVKTIQMLQKNSAQTFVSIDADKQLPYEKIAQFLAILQTNGIHKVKFKTLVAP